MSEHECEWGARDLQDLGSRGRHPGSLAGTCTDTSRALSRKLRCGGTFCRCTCRPLRCMPCLYRPPPQMLAFRSNCSTCDRRGVGADASARVVVERLHFPQRTHRHFSTVASNHALEHCSTADTAGVHRNETVCLPMGCVVVDGHGVCSHGLKHVIECISHREERVAGHLLAAV